MDSGETRTITCFSYVQQGDPMGPALFCLALRPVLKRFREEFEGEGVEAFAYELGQSILCRNRLLATPRKILRIWTWNSDTALFMQ